MTKIKKVGFCILFALSVLCSQVFGQNQALTINPSTHAVVNTVSGINFPKGLNSLGRPVNTNTSPFEANVLNYGATGNGVANDFPALLSAMLAVSNAGGGVISLPDNMTFRVTTLNANGILLTNMSNVEIKGGQHTILLMDNLQAGVANTAGIFVEGPCSNIYIHDLHVKYSQISSGREGGTYAPIYFLGANVGNGSGSPAWYRGNLNGTETPSAIDTGAIHNIKIENVTCENSPSVGIGIVGCDGISIHNVRLKNTWADGLYHLYVKNSQVSDVYEENVGDDAISMASYESDLANANITNAYHAEGSRVVNVFINGTYPPDGATNANLQVPAGGIAILGIRDVTFDNININDKFRALRFSTGLDTNGPDASPVQQNLNFLANHNIALNNFTVRGCQQNIAYSSQQSTIGEDPKWWNNQNVTINHFHADGGVATFTVYSDFVLFKVPVMAGVNFNDISMTGYSQPTFGTINNFTNCTFQNMYFDDTVNFGGFIPFAGNPDAVNSVSTLPVYPSQNSRIINVTAKEVSCVGMKNVYFDNITVKDSQQAGFVLSTSSDVTFGKIFCQNSAFTNNFGVPFQIDQYCKRVNGGGVYVDQGTNILVNAISLNSASNIFIQNVQIKTMMNSAYFLVYDQMMYQSQIGQVGRIDWLNGQEAGVTPEWMTRQFGGGYNTPTANFDFFPTTVLPTYYIEYPLSGNVTATLHPDSVKVGDLCTIARVASSTGNFAINVQGITAVPPAVVEQSAQGSFIIESAAAGSAITAVKVNNVNVMNSSVPASLDLVTTALMLSSNINYYESNVLGSPVYFANNFGGAQVVIQNVPNNASASYNGFSVAATTTGTILLDNFSPMAGGINPSSGGGSPSTYPLYTFPTNADGQATFIYGEGAWKFYSSTIPDTNLTKYLIINATATNTPANGNTLRYTNGNLYWGP